MQAADILAVFPATLLSFVTAFGLGALFWVVGLMVISFATPQRELALLRAGNSAASLDPCVFLEVSFAAYTF